MTDETTTCAYEEQAGAGNEAGHAFLHTMEGVAVMSVSQTLRSFVQSAAVALLVTFLFTHNWWVFGALVLAVIADILVHFAVRKADADVGQWMGYTLEMSKREAAKAKVAAAVMKDYRDKMTKGA